jgi:hypothetical protein
MNLEEELTNKAATQIANEIDFTILSDMLCGIGWTKIILRPMTWEAGAEIDQWTADNINGNFETMGLVWIFERPEEANWFALRWL